VICGRGGVDQVAVGCGRGASVFQVKGHGDHPSGLTRLEPALMGTG
jgi:hypothetical protein